MISFEYKKISALTGFTEVHYTHVDKDDGMFSVIADQRGMRFEGKSPIFSDIDELDILARTIGAAWEEHLKLKPKLSKTLSGH